MKKYISIIILTISLLPIYLRAQDSIFARNIIKNLSSPEMYGRGYSYGGDSIAANFIRNKCKEIGLLPLSDDYYQRLQFKSYKMEGDCSISIDSIVLKPGEDFYIKNFSSSVNSKNIPIIYTTVKNASNTKKLSKFLKKIEKAIAQSIVCIETTNELSDEEKAFLQNLNKRNPFGSVGIIIGGEQLPMASVSTRPSKCDYAIIHIKDNYLASKPQHISISFDNQAIRHNSQNVCAYIKGSEVADSFIVFSAHYDHLGTIGNKAYYPGAHDNASGVAALLDIATYFSKNQPKYSVVFLFFCGEEVGLIGSKYFVNHPLITLNKIKTLINMDMFCGGDEGIMIVNAKADETQPICKALCNINDTHKYISQIKTRPNAANSDHYFFSTHCPAIFIYTMGGKYGGYHDIHDTCESCGLENYENIIKLVIEGIKSL